MIVPFCDLTRNLARHLTRDLTRAIAASPEKVSSTFTCFRGLGLGFTAVEATQGQMDGFFSQVPYKCYLGEVASMGD